MKILIFYAKYGGGHLSAANSIKQYLESLNSDIEVETIDCMEYVNKTVNNLTTGAYRQMAKRYPWAWGKIYDESKKGPIAHISTRANQIFAIKLLQLLRQKDPDLIISTHAFGSQMCAYLKRKNKVSFKIATILTDFSPHDQWLVGSNETNYYFVANELIKNYITKTKKIKNPKVLISGIPINENFSKTYDRTGILKEFNLQEGKKTILFFCGGEYGLGKNKTLEIFKEMLKSKHLEDFQVIAIAGKNVEMKETLEQLSKDKHNILVLPFTDKVAQLMSVSDLVITKPGGLTTSESLAMGLPMVIINPIPGQEEENANYLVDKNIAKWIKEPQDTLKILDSLLNDDNLLKQMSNNAKEISKPHASKEICDFLLKDIEQSE